MYGAHPCRQGVIRYKKNIKHDSVFLRGQSLSIILVYGAVRSIRWGEIGFCPNIIIIEYGKEDFIMARIMLDDDSGKVKKDALIYQKRNDTDSKAEYEKLDKKGKFQFFKDYYLQNILIVLALVIIGGYYLVKAVNKPQNILYIAIADDTFQEEELDRLEKAVETYLGLDGKKEVVTINTDYSYKNGKSSEQLQSYLYAGSCDVVIASEEGLKGWAEGGYFLEPDSSELVSFYKDLDDSDRIYSKVMEGAEIRGEKEMDDTEYNFGISIVNCEKYKKLGGKNGTAVAAISNSSRHQEEAAAFLQFLLDDDLKAGDVNPDFAGTGK